MLIILIVVNNTIYNIDLLHIFCCNYMDIIMLFKALNMYRKSFTAIILFSSTIIFTISSATAVSSQNDTEVRTSHIAQNLLPIDNSESLFPFPYIRNDNSHSESFNIQWVENKKFSIIDNYFIEFDKEFEKNSFTNWIYNSHISTNHSLTFIPFYTNNNNTWVNQN